MMNGWRCEPPIPASHQILPSTQANVSESQLVKPLTSISPALSHRHCVRRDLRVLDRFQSLERPGHRQPSICLRERARAQAQGFVWLARLLC